jgi:hypothetical protein
MLEGSAISYAPNSDAESERKTKAIAATIHGLPSALPKPLPVSAEATPMGVKSATMPSTKVRDRRTPCRRPFASFAPKTDTVIAIIG